MTKETLGTVRYHENDDIDLTEEEIDSVMILIFSIIEGSNTKSDTAASLFISVGATISKMFGDIANPKYIPEATKKFNGILDICREEMNKAFLEGLKNQCTHIN